MALQELEKTISQNEKHTFDLKSLYDIINVRQSVLVSMYMIFALYREPIQNFQQSYKLHKAHSQHSETINA
jgi:hypothetical protein